MNCTKCNEKPVFIRKKGLCKSCYRRGRYTPRSNQSDRSSEIERTVAVAYTFGQKTPPEIAELIGMPVASVRYYLDKGRAKKFRGLPTVVKFKDSESIQRATAAARLLSRVTIRGANECWPWTGSAGATCPRSPQHVYGRLSAPKLLRDTKTPRTYPHRLMYQLFVGPIPKGMAVDHICFNTLCCNPAHLQLLTVAQNSSRKRSMFGTEAA